MKLIKKTSNKVGNFFSALLAVIKESTNVPLYKVVSVEKDEEKDTYVAIVQKTNSAQVIKLKPEEILADDELTNSFSQHDIRTLTYLGYLGINSPKYKILAKRLSEKDSNLVFAIKERGKKGVIVKSAEEVSSDKDILEKLDQKDAHEIGYTAGSQGANLERDVMAKLIKNKKKK